MSASRAADGRSLQLPLPADGRHTQAVPLSPRRVNSRRLLAGSPGRPTIHSRTRGRAPVGAR
eukprot:5023090-Alexandrium_andersonii.AAC.1